MLNVFVLYSVIENSDEIKKRSAKLVDKLLSSVINSQLVGYFESIADLENEFESLSDNTQGTIIVNTSGGTEALINKIAEQTDEPILLLADSQKNSFASSLEAYAHLKGNHKIKIFYSDDEFEKIASAQSFAKAVTALHKINNSHFCLIGDPSDWLLTSKDFEGFDPFRTKYTKIGVKELTTEVEKIVNGNTNELVENWKATYDEILVDDKSLHDSARVYLALKKIIEYYNADVISVRCFDLLEYNYTSCMGLSICNDEGITAGCEGDIPTTFSMMIAQQLSGSPVWMANPSSIDKEKNQITFAHCTVPSKFISNINEAGLTTHMESGKSTAIRGPLKNGEVTILRIGKNFKKIVAANGKIIESDMKKVNLCRTQAIVQLESKVEKWIEESLGNHHVIVYGNLSNELKYLSDFAGIEFIQL